MSAAGPACGPCRLERRRAGREQQPQPGPLVRRAEAQGRARRPRQGSCRSAPRPWPGRRHRRSSSRRCRTCASAAASRRASTSSSCRGSTGPSSTLGGPRSPTRMGRDPPTFTDVTTDLQNTALQATVTVDRDKATRAGHRRGRAALDPLHGLRHAPDLDHLHAGRQLRGASSSSIRACNWSADRLDLVRIRNANGRLVPLSRLRDGRRGPSARSSVNQLGQSAGDHGVLQHPGRALPLGDAVQRIEAHQGASSACRPTISTTFAGTAQIFQDALGNQGLLLGAAVLTIYIVLGMLYESFIHPLTILTGLPAAASAPWSRSGCSVSTSRSSR